MIASVESARLSVDIAQLGVAVTMSALALTIAALLLQIPLWLIYARLGEMTRQAESIKEEGSAEG